MATHLCRCLEHTRAQTLTGHFHQAKARDATNLNTGTVGFQRIFHPFFNGDVVAALVHVDEIDHDQTSQVTQAGLTRHFIGGLKVGLGRCLFNRRFFGRTTGVHVNRNKRFGDTNHDITTRRQLNRRVKHTVQVAFNLIARVKRHLFGIAFHVLGMGRHDHFHEVLGRAVTALACNDHFVDVFVVKIADRPFD